MQKNSLLVSNLTIVVIDSFQEKAIETIPIRECDAARVTDGMYYYSYLPTVSGRYNLTMKWRTSGGLLARYYIKKDWTKPILAAHEYLYDGYYHDPYWCDGLRAGNFSSFQNYGPVTFCDAGLDGCGCDSTASCDPHANSTFF